jgi:hypothetical protein
VDSIAGQVVRARSERLVTKTVGDEIVIYDLDTDKAHLLNPASAVLWRLCERGATVGMLRAALEAELNTNGTTEELLWTALDDLSKAGLLETDTSFVGRPTGMTRRSLLKKAGILAIAAPAITTIVAPPAAAQTTGECVQATLDDTNTCTSPEQCCGNSLGTTCEGGQCCRPKGFTCAAELCCGGTVCSSGTCCYTTVKGTTSCGTNNAICCGDNICHNNQCCVPSGMKATQESDCCSNKWNGTGTNQQKCTGNV